MVLVSRAVRGMVAMILGGVVVLGVSGCTPESDTATEVDGPSASPSPTAEPSPSVDPTQAAIDERSAQAAERYREYWDIVAEYATKGEIPLAEIDGRGYISGDFAQLEQERWGSFEAEGWKGVGAVEVVAIEAVDYEGDPFDENTASHRVHLEVCLDNSDWDVVDAGGESVFASKSDRVVMKAQMLGRTQAGIWSLDKAERIEGAVC